MFSSREKFERRRTRNRTALRKKSHGQPRLSIHRSSRHIYAQIIDDKAGLTLAFASTLESDFRSAGKTGADVSAAAVIGKKVAERGAEKGVKNVVFDRGGYVFHGRVKALADAAREAGLEF